MTGKPVYTQEESDARVRRALARERGQQLEAPRSHVEPAQHRPAEPLLSTPGLVEHFNPVPETFFHREGGTAVIECPCGWAEPEDAAMRSQRVEFGDLHECPGCLRIYFLGNRLHAAAPEDAPGIEHSHPISEPCLPPCPEYA